MHKAAGRGGLGEGQPSLTGPTQAAIIASLGLRPRTYVHTSSDLPTDRQTDRFGARWKPPSLTLLGEWRNEKFLSVPQTCLVELWW